jgi:hypothetical protein
VRIADARHAPQSRPTQVRKALEDPRFAGEAHAAAARRSYGAGSAARTARVTVLVKSAEVMLATE